MLKISEELFVMLCRYHLLDMRGDEALICQGLREKLDALERRSLYGKAIKGDEEARQRYLNLIGMNSDFKW